MPLIKGKAENEPTARKNKVVPEIMACNDSLEYLKRHILVFFGISCNQALKGRTNGSPKGSKPVAIIRQAIIFAKSSEPEEVANKLYQTLS